MRMTITPAARRAIEAWIARDPARPLLRLSFAGGCGAMGFRLATAARALPGDERVAVDGLPILMDFKSRSDLDGARLDVSAEAPDEILILHDRAVVGSSC